jgi:hypothetical protein
MLAAGDAVTECLATAGGGWAARVAPHAANTDISFTGAELCLRLSDEDLERLLLPESEGVYFRTDTTPMLRYFIEKDFPCVHPRPADALEPETETFAAPDDFEARKNAC